MLTVITGPMYSGKTSCLISKVTSYAVAGKFALCFKPSNDTRYDANNAVSHDGQKTVAIPIDRGSPIHCFKYIAEFENVGRTVDVVCFDEAQFFYKGRFEQIISQLLYVEHRTLIISGLSQDYDGKPFGAMPYCLAIADDIVHLKAVCNKSKEIGVATRTYKKSGNNNQVEVGGTELYEARSFRHWIEENEI